MPVNIDLKNLISDMTQALSGVLKKDIKTVRGYSRHKMEAIATYTKLIGEGYANGEIDNAQLKEEKKELDDMVARYVRNLEASANVTVERLIKTVTSTLYGAIRTAAGAAGVALPSLEEPEG